jgi:hypothetical protein
VSGDIDIDGRSRRFRIAVVATAALVLLAAALAVASLNPDASGLQEDSGDQGTPPDGTPGSGNGDFGSSDGTGIVEGISKVLDILPGFNPDTTPDIDGEPDGERPDGEVPETSPDTPGDRPGGPGGRPGSPELPDGGRQVEVPPPPYNISVEPQPTPGRTVVVTVTRDGDPVPFAVVSFNEVAVGRTNTSGQVDATVPYATELEVTARPPVEEPPDEPDDDESTDNRPFETDLPPAGTGGTALAGAGDRTLHTVVRDSVPPDHHSVPVSQSETRNLRGDAETTHARPYQSGTDGSRRTYEVLTNVSTNATVVPLPGERVRVRFTVDGAPLPYVIVSMAGTEVSGTGANGKAMVPIPEDAALGGSVPVSLKRGEFAAEASVEVGEPEVSVDTGLLPLPMTPAETTVWVVDSTDRRPLADVPVEVRQDTELLAAADTDDDGTVTFTLPWANSVTATGTVDGQSVTGTATGMLYVTAVLAVVLVALLAGAVGLGWRKRDALGGTRSQVVAALVAAGESLLRAGRWLDTSLRGLAGRLWRALSRVGPGVRSLFARMRTALRERSVRPAVVALGSALLGTVVQILAALWRGLRWLAALPGRLLGGLRDTAEDTDSNDTAADPETGARPGPPAYERLLRYWGWLVRRVSGTETTTAVEIEQRAVEVGLPARPVRRLRRAFQDVEYGFADAEERVDAAESAHDQLRAEDDQ